MQIESETWETLHGLRPRMDDKTGDNVVIRSVAGELFVAVAKFRSKIIFRASPPPPGSRFARRAEDSWSSIFQRRYEILVSGGGAAGAIFRRMQIVLTIYAETMGIFA